MADMKNTHQFEENLLLISAVCYIKQTFDNLILEVTLREKDKNFDKHLKKTWNLWNG